MQQIVNQVKLQSRVNFDIVSARLSALLSSSPSVRPVLANSLPKGGTHLLVRMLEQLPGLHRVRLQLSSMTYEAFRPVGDEPTVPVGVVSLCECSQSKIRSQLARLPVNCFITSHISHSEVFGALLRDLDMRMVTMVRDPRDVALSSARYLTVQQSHRLHRYFMALSEDDRILACIRGVTVDGRMLYPGVRCATERVLGWATDPRVCMTRFEDLVGPLGGGTGEQQKRTIADIASHIGVLLDDGRIELLGNQIFGGSATFHKGQIGAWREAFSSAHCDAAKEEFGDLLIRLQYEDDDDW